MVNPEKGYIATANNKIAPENYPYHISHIWAQPYRYMRIEEVLSEKSDLTVEDMQTLQMDQMNLQAKEFVPLYLDALKGIHLSLSEQEVLKVLSSWNFRDDQNLAAPLIFHKWKKEIESVIYEDIPEEMMEFFKAKGQTTDELMRKAFRGETVAWIEEKGGIQSVLRTSLSKAVKQLRKEHGTEVLNWKWGDAHQVSFVHPLSSVKVLSYFFNPEDPLPVGGSGVTVMAAKKGTDGMVDHGAPWRFVADLSDLSQAWHMVAPGQSGHFKSQWYDDQMDDWVNGDYHVTKLKEMEGKTLYLIPEG